MTSAKSIIPSLLMFVSCAFAGTTLAAPDQASLNGIALDQASLNSASEQLFSRYIRHQRLPLLTQTYTLNEQRAYQLQAEFVAKYTEHSSPTNPVVGYKAALTTAAMRQQWASPSPIFGILTKNMLQSAPASVEFLDDAIYLAELELAYVIKSERTQPFSHIQEFVAAIDAVIPVVELPEIYLAGKPTYTDIIASNVGAYKVIVSPTKLPVQKLDLATLHATLECDGKILTQSDDASQITQHAFDLANQVIAQGHPLHAGDFLLAGALQAQPPRIKSAQCTASYFQNTGLIDDFSFTINTSTPDKSTE